MRQRQIAEDQLLKDSSLCRTWFLALDSVIPGLPFDRWDVRLHLFLDAIKSDITRECILKMPSDSQVRGCLKSPGRS
jgi:hypothetical protein